MNTEAIERDEIETLCVLLALREGGCDAAELARRLGLAASIAHVVGEIVEPLLARRWVWMDGDRVSLATAGERALHARLSELGVGAHRTSNRSGAKLGSSGAESTMTASFARLEGTADDDTIT